MQGLGARKGPSRGPPSVVVWMSILEAPEREEILIFFLVMMCFNHFLGLNLDFRPLTLWDPFCSYYVRLRV